jgi:seryl-tRNA synthetase
MNRDTIKATLRSAIERRLAHNRAQQTTTVVREPDMALTVRAVSRALHWQNLRGKPDLAPLQHRHTDVHNRLDALQATVRDVRAYSNQIAKQIDDVATRRIDAARIDHLEHTHPDVERTLDQVRFLINDLERTLDELIARVDDQDAMMVLPGDGKPGQVLVKTRTGVAWEWLQPQIVQLKKKEVTDIDGVIVDSEGTFLVDSEGTYLEAL